MGRGGKREGGEGKGEEKKAGSMASEEPVCQGGTRFQEACYGKVLLGREMEKGGTGHRARFINSFVHLLLHSSNKTKDASVVIIANQDTGICKRRQKFKEGANNSLGGCRSGEVKGAGKFH